MKTHNKQFFYKYVSANTVRLILENNKLQYSSPSIFNDPFDVQTSAGYAFDPDDLFSLLSKKMSIGVEEFVEMFKEEYKRLDEWWKLVVKCSRVFCVAEENDNLLMWAHYADDHKGAVIKFECLPDIGNSLCVAKKVKYVDKPPVLAEIDEYIESLVGEHEIDYGSLFIDLFISKSDHWNYEKEWRVFIPPIDMENPIVPKDSNGKEVFSTLVDLYPKEIHSIYLGCKMKEDIQNEIGNTLIDDFSHVQIYKSKKDERDYKLNFEQIR